MLGTGTNFSIGAKIHFKKPPSVSSVAGGDDTRPSRKGKTAILFIFKKGTIFWPKIGKNRQNSAHNIDPRAVSHFIVV
jgi:Zn/Cd-binding protein ZinT